jgi:hypothetical protein
MEMVLLLMMERPMKLHLLLRMAVTDGGGKEAKQGRSLVEEKGKKNRHSRLAREKRKTNIGSCVAEKVYQPCASRR